MQSSFIRYQHTDPQRYVIRGAQEFCNEYLCAQLLGKVPSDTIWHSIEDTCNNYKTYDEHKGLTENVARLSSVIFRRCEQQFGNIFERLTGKDLMDKVDAFLTEMEKEDERADTLQWIDQERKFGRFDKAGYDEARRTVKDSN